MGKRSRNNKCDKTTNKGNIPNKRSSGSVKGSDYAADRNGKSLNDHFRDAKGSTSNDPSWYAQDATLMNNAANLPYSFALGSRIPSELHITEESIPGIMALKLTPSIGNTNSGVSPINVAANNIYSFVRHMNSGASNYDAPDLMIYLLAMDSCYSFYSYLTRIYGVMRTYSPLNYYYPQGYIQAMGVDFEDIQGRLPELLYYINMYSAKLSTLRIPNTMPYLSRHMWMYSGIYKDEEGDKAQSLLYVPDGFFKYNESLVDTTNLGNLTYKQLKAKNTLDDLMAFGDELLDVNRASEDHNIMSGDIAKAYGNNVFTVPAISADYTVIPTYDQEVLDQMHNATVLTGFENKGVVQNPTTGVLTNKITAPTNLGEWADKDGVVNNKRILNMHTMDPTSSNTMVATRLMAGVMKQTNGEYLVTTSGSEVVIGMSIYSYSEDHMTR